MFSPLLHLFYPHSCEGCGRDLSRHEEVLCLRCYQRMPATRFHMVANNPIEKLFWGRSPVAHGSAAYFFGKRSNLQQLIHSFKYLGRRDIALYLGRQMGNMLLECPWFNDVSGVVPVPLFKSRERKRGYNQAGVLGEGIKDVTGCPLLHDVLKRKNYTQTQTHKGRGDRWQNVGDVFAGQHLAQLENKHVLLVDDVLTTGATLEACARQLQQGHNVTVSIFCLAYTMI
ncbi:phosphoribosyltransferase family protein [Chitinophaga horti]|uniref:Phosphoribosyltransferase family protein n=1 Tax=Chitinophaga horti TaxID=2920382 RepID=A0ABY6J003_9BACT|nr:phosphoribosyltransferase family protein [Chitinophaga horti]UYQ92976.1 phosphoribosyltransferase family protein [Chitinophaga horti]